MRLRSLLLASAIAIAAAGDAPAQSPATQPAEAQPQLIDLALDETNIRSYIDFLAETTNANFILLHAQDVDPAMIKVPRLRLRQIRVTDAVSVLSMLPGATVEVEHDNGGPVPNFVVTVHKAPALAKRRGPDGRAPDDPLAAAAGPSIVTRVLPLERLLMGDNPAELVPEEARRAQIMKERVPQAMQLVEQVLLMQAADAKLPEMKLHEATNTLLVKGSPEQLAAVQEAITALALPRPSDQAKAFEAVWRDQQSRNVQESTVLKAELQALRDRLQAEQTEAQAKVGRLQAEVERLKAELITRADRAAASQPKP